jgi:dihydroflavonol-4-reductase
MVSLVTGGAGFIGRHLVERLKAGGARVRVLDMEATPGLPPGVDLMRGSVDDPAAVRRACRGVRRLYHLAALTHLWGRDKRAFHRVNVRGTEVVLEEAARTQVERMVHVSSETVLIGRRQPTGLASIDERHEVPVAELLGPYCRSKGQAEQASLAAARAGLPVVVVNPTLPLGPGDWRLTPPTVMIRDFVDGRHPAYLDWILNVIDVRDAAAGIELAAARGRVGERYILGGTNLSMGELLAELEAVTGRRMPRLRVPGAIAWLVAAVSEAVADHLTGRPPKAPLSGVRLALRGVRFDNAKARRELGLAVRPLRETLVDCIAWLARARLLARDLPRAAPALAAAARRS